MSAARIRSSSADMDSAGAPPLTPDRRYLVVRGRLWRATNPNLSAVERARWVAALMDARRAVHSAMRSGNDAELGHAVR